MSKNKSNKHSPIRVAKNLWFMLKYSFKYAPSYTFVTLGEALGRGAWHIIGVLFTKYLFDSIEAGIEFPTVLFWILLVAGYNAAFELFNKWRLEVYVPKVMLILTKEYKTSFTKKPGSLTKAATMIPNFIMILFGLSVNLTTAPCRSWRISAFLSTVLYPVR